MNKVQDFEFTNTPPKGYKHTEHSYFHSFDELLGHQFTVVCTGWRSIVVKTDKGVLLCMGISSIDEGHRIQDISDVEQEA